MDARRDHTRFEFHAFHLLRATLIRHKYLHRKHCRIHGFGIIRSRIKRRVFVIHHISKVSAHDLIKNIIDPGKHFISASEIFLQIDTLTSRHSCGIGVEFFHKKLRSRQAETVNTLFYIPHHKKVILPKPFL